MKSSTVLNVIYDPAIDTNDPYPSCCSAFLQETIKVIIIGKQWVGCISWCVHMYVTTVCRSGLVSRAVLGITDGTHYTYIQTYIHSKGKDTRQTYGIMVINQWCVPLYTNALCWRMVHNRFLLHLLANREETYWYQMTPSLGFCCRVLHHVRSNWSAVAVKSKHSGCLGL